MKCTVVVLVSLLALLATNVRSAPQRGIDFLPRDEEVQAVVKPIAADSGVPDQQHQLAAQDQNDHEDDEQQQQQQEQQEREQPEVPATVDPVENEHPTEDPANELADDEDTIDEHQFKQDEQEDVFDPVTDQPEETVPESPDKNDSPSETASDAVTMPTTSTTSAQHDATPANDESKPLDPVVEHSTEEQLTTEPIVVPDQTSTESNDDHQLAEDVNSLADGSSDRVRFGLEENQDQPDSSRPAAAAPTPKSPAQDVRPHPATEQPAVLLSTGTSEEYDSKSLESHEDDDQVQLKVGPNDVQSSGEDQLRALPPWFGTTRFPGYDQQWHQQTGSFPQRSSWQPRPTGYQANSFDGFHGHGFHRSAWH